MHPNTVLEASIRIVNKVLESPVLGGTSDLMGQVDAKEISVDDKSLEGWWCGRGGGEEG